MSETAVETASASADPPDIKKIGKYDVLGAIGRGTYGIVYKAYDPFLQREVAIKLLRDVPKRQGQAVARNAQEAFFAEVRAAGRLHHPYVVLLYDAGIEAGNHYIVMEYVQGETLRRHCQREGPRLPNEVVMDLMLKCALALDYVHECGVLHKDIKPSNIMIRKDGSPKIMDFSIAGPGEAEEDTEEVMGSPMYMSPEQIRGRDLGPPSDLYSLGTVMYQLLTGVPPFSASETKQLFQLIKHLPPPPLSTLRPDLPESLSRIVDKLLAKVPGARYPTGRALAEDLAPLTENRGKSSRRKGLEISHDALKKLHFFRAFKTRELGELLDASQTLTHKAGATIIREGEIDNALYILLAGIAEVRKGGKPIAVLEKGDSFGEIGFLYAVKRTASVVATTDVLMLRVNAALLEQMSEDCQLRYYKIFCENLIVRLSLTTEKVARLLPNSDLSMDIILP